MFAIEERELTAYNTPGGTLVEFASRVTTTGRRYQARRRPAARRFSLPRQQRSERQDRQADVLPAARRPGQAGRDAQLARAQRARRSALERDELCGRRSAIHGAVSRQARRIPKEARFSERDYGRFGSYFEYTITKEKPLEVNYRVWVQRGELTGEQAAASRQEFRRAGEGDSSVMASGVSDKSPDLSAIPMEL